MRELSSLETSFVVGGRAATKPTTPPARPGGCTDGGGFPIPSTELPNGTTVCGVENEAARKHAQELNTELGLTGLRCWQFPDGTYACTGGQ